MSPRVVDPGRDGGAVPADSRRRKRVAALAAEIAAVGYALPGSVSSRFTHCGRPGCKCMADPPSPHGPYWWWTRKVANKTVTQILSADQYADYEPWFANARRLRDLLSELESLGLAVVEADPRSRRRAHTASTSPPAPQPPSPRPQHR